VTETFIWLGRRRGGSDGVQAARGRRQHSLDDSHRLCSLSHLRQFPIDKLKIDKSFVQSVESVAIVDAVINMGLSLGMQVIAEGVEKQTKSACCG